MAGNPASTFIELSTSAVCASLESRSHFEGNERELTFPNAVLPGVVRRSNIAARDVSPSPAVARRAAAAKALKKRAMFKGKASSIMTGTKLAAIARRIRCGQSASSSLFLSSSLP